MLFRSRQRDKKGKKRAGKEFTVEEDNGGKPTDAKEAMQQKLIARKRLMRKKKAMAREKA